MDKSKCYTRRVEKHDGFYFFKFNANNETEKLLEIEVDQSSLPKDHHE